MHCLVYLLGVDSIDWTNVCAAVHRSTLVPMVDANQRHSEASVDSYLHVDFDKSLDRNRSDSVIIADAIFDADSLLRLAAVAAAVAAATIVAPAVVAASDLHSHGRNAAWLVDIGMAAAIARHHTNADDC